LQFDEIVDYIFRHIPDIGDMLCIVTADVAVAPLTGVVAVCADLANVTAVCADLVDAEVEC
jgi:hypothetical protein